MHDFHLRVETLMRLNSNRKLVDFNFEVKEVDNNGKNKILLFNSAYFYLHK